MAAAARPGPGAEELALLEKLLGLPKGNKYGVQGERKVPVLQTNNGPGLTGLMTIAAHLVKQAKKDQLLGSTAEEKAVVQQWLEYRVTRVDGRSSKDDTRIILKVEAEKRISRVTLLFEQPDGRDLFGVEDLEYNACFTRIMDLVKALKSHFSHTPDNLNCLDLIDLNIHLEDKVYLAGNVFTLADILMYYGLHHVMADLTVQEKEEYLNVSRWFNHIQHYPGVRQHLSNVVFIKNRLYTNAH